MGLIPRGGGTGASTDDDKKCCCAHCGCPHCCCCDSDVDLPPEEEEVRNDGAGQHNRLQGLQGGTVADRFHVDKYHYDTLLKLSTSFIDGVEYLMFNGQPIAGTGGGMTTKVHVATVLQGQMMVDLPWSIPANNRPLTFILVGGLLPLRFGADFLISEDGSMIMLNEDINQSGDNLAPFASTPVISTEVSVYAFF